MSRELVLAAIRDWFERVWNQLDEGAIEEMMAEDCEVLGVSAMPVNREQYVEFYRTVRSAFDEIRMEIADVVVEEDAAAGHVRFSGKHRDSGKEVDFVFSFAARLEEGRFVWVRNVVDYSLLLYQLGDFDLAAIERVFES